MGFFVVAMVLSELVGSLPTNPVIRRVDNRLFTALHAVAQKHDKLKFVEAIEFKDAPVSISRFVGAHYTLDPFDLKDPEKSRSMEINMTGNVNKMCERFQADSGVDLSKRAETPYIADQAWAEPADGEGRYARMGDHQVGCGRDSSMSQMPRRPPLE